MSTFSPSSFCNRVVKEAKHCHFKCKHDDCSAESTAIRDQIVIGTINNTIREEALRKSFDLDTLRRVGMQIESAERGGAEISGEGLNRLGKYSYSNIKSEVVQKNSNQDTRKKTINCYNCGNVIKGSISKHKEKCPAQSSKCSKCSKIGHFPQVCRSKTVSHIDELGQKSESHSEEPEDAAYNINVFRLKKVHSSKTMPAFKSTEK